jgi:predicted Zn-dependent protease
MELTIAEALQQGIQAHKAGQFQEAERLYRAILTTQPQHTDANHNLGVLAVQFGKLTEAVPLFEEVIKANPTVEQYWVSYLDVLLKLGRLNDAEQALAGARWWKIRGPKLYRLEKQLKQRLADQHTESSHATQASDVVPISQSIESPSEEATEQVVLPEKAESKPPAKGTKNRRTTKKEQDGTDD